MVSGIPLETCWAFNKFWNNKFYYKVTSCWLFLLIHTTMHGSMDIKKNPDADIYNSFLWLAFKGHLSILRMLSVTCVRNVEYCANVLKARHYFEHFHHQNRLFTLPHVNDDDSKHINTLRTGSFKLFKRPFPGFLTILTF